MQIGTIQNCYKAKKGVRQRDNLDAVIIPERIIGYRYTKGINYLLLSMYLHQT